MTVIGKSILTGAVQSVLVWLSLVLIWQLVVWGTQVQSFILPSPIQVLITFREHFGLIMYHAGVTATEVIVGLLLGVAAGVLTALCLMRSKRARKLLLPALVMSQTVPVFALAPILTLWLGYGLVSKIAMTVLIVYFPVTSTFLDGLRSTPTGYLDLAQTMRSTRTSTLLQIRVPAAFPSLASGIRLAAVYAPIGAVIGEWVGASNGLGYLMLLANGRVKVDLMFAALVALCLLTVIIRATVDLACDRMIREMR